jgi:hypothetical protein
MKVELSQRQINELILLLEEKIDQEPDVGRADYWNDIKCLLEKR